MQLHMQDWRSRRGPKYINYQFIVAFDSMRMDEITKRISVEKKVDSLEKGWKIKD